MQAAESKLFMSSGLSNMLFHYSILLDDSFDLLLFLPINQDTDNDFVKLLFTCVAYGLFFPAITAL